MPPRLPRLRPFLARLFGAALAAAVLAASPAPAGAAANPVVRWAAVESINRGVEAYRQKRWEEAERILTDVLALIERELADDEPLLANALGNLGYVRLQRRNYAGAIPLFARQLAIGERIAKPGDPGLVTVLGNYADALEGAGRHPEAEMIYARVLDIRRTTTPLDPVRLADAHRNLADSIRRQQRPAQARSHFADAAALYRTVADPSAEVRRRLAISLSNIGFVDLEAGRLDEAAESYDEALALFAALPRRDIDWSNTASNRARIDRRRGRLAEAEALMRQVLNWRRTTLKPADPAVAAAHYELGLIFADAKRWSEAEEQFRIGFAVIEQGRAPSDLTRANYLAQIGIMLRRQGRLQEAIETYTRAATLRTTMLDLDDPLLVTTVQNLAGMIRQAGNPRQADAFLAQIPGAKAREDEVALAPDALDLLMLDKFLSGAHRDAVRLLEAAVGAAEGAGDDERLIRLLGIRSHLRALLDLYDTAAEDVARARALLAGRSAPSPSLKAALLFYDALVRLQTGRDPAGVDALLAEAAALVAETGPADRRLRLRIRAAQLDQLQAAGRIEAAKAAAPDLEEAYAGFAEDDPDRISAELIAIRTLELAGETAPAGRRLAGVLERLRDLGDRRAVFVPMVLQRIAALESVDGRTGLREMVLRDALTISSLKLPANHSQAALVLADLADVMLIQGRLAEGEELSRRALAIFQGKPGLNPATAAPIALRLASTLNYRGRPAEALPLARSGVDLLRGHPTGAPALPGALSTLALIQSDLGRHEAAASALDEAEVHAAAYPPGHAVRISLATMRATLAFNAGRYREAAGHYERARDELARRESIRPDRQVWFVNHGLAVARWMAADKPGARTAIADATAALTRMLAVDSADLGDAAEGQRRAVRVSFELEARLAVPDGATDAATGAPASPEAFAATQWALSTAAARALAQVGARFGAGSGELAGLVRQRQDLIETWKATDKALLAAVGGAGADQAGKARQLRDELQKIRRAIDALDARLATEYPNFADLSNPRPLPIEETARLLRADEALLVTLVTGDETLVAVVTREGSAAYRVALADKDLADMVARLRATLDPSGSTRAAESGFGEAVTSGFASFDRSTAHVLWQKLLAPALPLIAGKRHLLVVPDGALTSLPLAVLVTEPPTGDDADPAALRATPWLIRRFALTTLPSVSSLKALRVVTRRAEAAEPLRAFGAPKLAGPAGEARGAPQARGGPEARGGPASRSAGAFFRGRLADVDAVRALSPLPGTEEELRALARTLAAPTDAVALGEAATETAVKRAKLGSARIVAFATHGLVTGELGGLVEPALVFTPPAVASEEDDGLLTASEAARLELAADWVVLSACNTAAGDGTPGAEGLSGLARAFLFAGARAILVSHWPVRDDAARLLTTRTFAAIAAEPGLGRAEALRRATEAVLADEADDTLAHPAAWAPFVVVGEGGGEVAGGG